MFVTGMIAELEARLRATATEKATNGIPAAKRVARAGARSRSVSDKVDAPLVDEIASLFGAVQLQLNNRVQLTEAADQITQQGYPFAEKTEADLSSLDRFIPKIDRYKQRANRSAAHPSLEDQTRKSSARRCLRRPFETLLEFICNCVQNHSYLEGSGPRSSNDGVFCAVPASHAPLLRDRMDHVFDGGRSTPAVNGDWIGWQTNGRPTTRFPQSQPGRRQAWW